MAAALAKGASSMLGSVGTSNPTSPEKYTLLKSVDVEENIKNIGDGILKTFAKEQMQDIDQIKSNPEDFKKQIRKDLIYIYYQHDETADDNGKHPVLFNPEKVRYDIKKQILSSWYAALDLRKKYIINNGLKYLLENHDKIIPNPSSKKGGGLSSALSGLGSKMIGAKDSLSGLKGKVTGDQAKMQKDILKQMGSDDPNDAEDGEQDPKLQGDYNPKNEYGDEFYFNKLVEYKTKLFSKNVTKNKKSQYFASGSQAVKLHQKILYKVIRHYSGIPRKYLSTTLRRIILGDDAIGYISQYKTRISYKRSPNKVTGIYDLFIAQITNLKDGVIKDVITLHEDQVSQDGVVLEIVGGDDGKIPNYMPTSYVWKKIKSHVQQDYRKLIKTNLEPLSEHIKEAFKDVFRVVNCDALTFFSDKKDAAKIMNDHLQNDFNKILEFMCEKMPDNFAVNILQNYIKNNTKNFIQFLTGNVFHTVSTNATKFQSFIDAFLNNTNLQPEFPQFDYDKPFKGKNAEIDAYVEKLEACCKKEISDADRTPDNSKVPKIIIGEDVAIHLAQIEGLPGFFESLMAPSKDKQYIELPVFELFKEQFMQCSDDVALLAELFNMYSSRSIQFMQKVQGRFYIGNTQMNEYIIKFILTKHKYTTKIISECIRHVADIKLSLSKLSPEIVNIEELISKYATFLIFSVSKTSLKVTKPENGDYINFFTEIHTEINNDTPNIISDPIISKLFIDEDGIKKYNSELTKLFALNDTIQPPPFIIQDAIANSVMEVEAQENPSGNSLNGQLNDAEVYSQNTNGALPTQVNSNVNPNASTMLESAQEVNKQLGNVQTTIDQLKQASQGNIILGDQRPPSQRNGLNIGNLGDTFNTSSKFLSLFSQG